jgi:hypothetical protein
MATAHIHGRVKQDGHLHRIAVDLTFDPADPLKVALECGSTFWLIGRDLLITGLEAPAGLGDIRVWLHGKWLHIQLHGNETGSWEDPAYAAVLELPYEPVHSFIAGTELEVPPGTERVDVDAWLVELLGGDRS